MNGSTTDLTSRARFELAILSRAEAMTAPREPHRPPSPPDRLPSPRGGHPSSQTASAAARPAGFARLAGARRGLVHSVWTLAAAALLALVGGLALPATAEAQLPTLSDWEAAEGEDVTFTVTLSEAEDVTATWTALIESGDTAVAADLGSTKTGMVTVPASNTTATFTVATAEDRTDEENETFTVTLFYSAGDPATSYQLIAKGTIIDDDPPTGIRVLDAAAAEGNDVKFTVALTARSGKQVTVDYATANGSA